MIQLLALGHCDSGLRQSSEKPHGQAECSPSSSGKHSPLVRQKIAIGNGNSIFHRTKHRCHRVIHKGSVTQKAKILGFISLLIRTVALATAAAEKIKPIQFDGVSAVAPAVPSIRMF